MPNSLAESDNSNNDHHSVASTASPRRPLKEKTMPFPNKLYDMLEKAELEGFDHVICWERNGKAFFIKDPIILENEVLPRFFNQTKYRSFLRQLQLYDFFRTFRGPKRGLCHHRFFQRGATDQLHKIKRTKRDSSETLQDKSLLSSSSRSSSSIDLEKVEMKDGDSSVTSALDEIPSNRLLQDAIDQSLASPLTDSYRGYFCIHGQPSRSSLHAKKDEDNLEKMEEESAFFMEEQQANALTMLNDHRASTPSPLFNESISKMSMPITSSTSSAAGAARLAIESQDSLHCTSWKKAGRLSPIESDEDVYSNFLDAAGEPRSVKGEKEEMLFSGRRFFPIR